MTYMERLSPKGFLFQERSFYVFFSFFFFFTIGKECLEIRQFAKFESDLLKTNEDIARPQGREILQTFVWWGSGTVLAPPPPRPQSREILQTFVWWGSGTVLVPPPPLPDTHLIMHKRQ